ncbi:ExeA family protein [Sulfuritalea hydrogenivorans]|jgi:MSHA biogenesis protein MshM|uniref:Type II secretory pathway protein ExeA n=1 Tax=Sulfuritalea hydrogenivorans sk43H TaxID=1223802 RepID=W0SBY5_9PROT|nr:AAA family ATPase [Sulfuritalea hydrogenivorans]MDK9715881.1 AAA family ATPase [Sulfuritalea sp.]BAO28541.1 type II secretory pathway protein ExeA [Sulfuritalea hydrogenivorans sk43H]
MYLNHFGLHEFPFGITPDTSFIYSADAHQEALNTLLIGLNTGEGFIKITGEVGTGKTLLCRRFLATLGDDQVVAYLPNPMLEPRILLIAIAEELGLKLQGLDYQFHLLKEFNQHLLDMAAQGKKVVICIDEAQSMPLASLEALRLLSNLETEKSKLLQVVMFGQPELDEKLSNPAVRQLRQRIVFHYRMPGLKQQESAHYLAHRLRVAGHRDGDVFQPGSARLLFRLSSGTPRLVNVLAHKSMLLAYGEGKTRVSRNHVLLAGRDTEGLPPLHWWQRW